MIIDHEQLMNDYYHMFLYDLLVLNIDNTEIYHQEILLNLKESRSIK